MPKAQSPVEMVNVKVTVAFKDEQGNDISVGEHEFPKAKFEEWKKNGIVKEGAEIISTPVPNVTVHPDPVEAKKDEPRNAQNFPGLSSELLITHFK